MRGGDGRDGTSYLTSLGAVHIDLLINGANGGDATGDVLVEIEDVQGSMFDDILSGNHKDNRLDGWYGDDILEGRGGTDTLIGGDGDDIIYAGADGDRLSRGNGIDLLSYRGRAAGVTVNLRNGTGSGGDIIGDFDDTNQFHQNTSGLSEFENLDGSKLGDNLTGDLGNNIIRGLNGADVINGHDGDDTLIGGADGDQLTGGDGIDWADYSTSFAGVTANLGSGGSGGEAAGDTYDTIENLRGTDLADMLVGDGQNNVIDPRLSLFGTDQVDGAGGTDMLFLNYLRGDYGDGVIGGFTNWASGAGSFTRSAGATLLDAVSFTSIEQLYAIGTIRDDVINAASGDDTLYGLSGNDVLRGGLGADHVYGGEGDDFVVHGNGRESRAGHGRGLRRGQQGGLPLWRGGHRHALDIARLGDARHNPDRQCHPGCGIRRLEPDDGLLGRQRVAASRSCATSSPARARTASPRSASTTTSSARAGMSTSSVPAWASTRSTAATTSSLGSRSNTARRRSTTRRSTITSRFARSSSKGPTSRPTPATCSNSTIRAIRERAGSPVRSRGNSRTSASGAATRGRTPTRC